jgi:hypothetical protein
MNAIEYFFDKKYYPYLAEEVAGPLTGAHINILLFLVAFIFMLIMGLQLKPAEQASDFLPKWHPLQKFFTYWAGDSSPFRQSDQDEMVQLTFTWGLLNESPGPLDISSADPYSSTERGVVQFNPKFDLAKEESQTFFMKTCDKLVNAEGSDGTQSSYGGKLTRQGKLEPQSAECHCIVNDAVAYYNALRPSSESRSTIPEADFISVIQDFLKTRDGAKRSSLIGLDKDNKDVPRKPYFVHIKCNSSALDQWAPYVQFEPYEKAANDFVADHITDAPEGMDTFFQSSAMWVRNHTQRLYLVNAISGILVSLLLAFIILFLSSANIIVTVLATMNIIGVVVSIAGMMTILGWELGTIESVCLTILVGLSVDYVVHLSNCYMESAETSRKARTRSALAEMGITVVGGAITSIGASSMLFACWLSFLYKFGFFMF